MERNEMKKLNMTKESYEQAKSDAKAIIKNQTNDWKEIKSFMEKLKYELWKELN